MNNSNNNNNTTLKQFWRLPSVKDLQRDFDHFLFQQYMKGLPGAPKSYL